VAICNKSRNLLAAILRAVSVSGEEEDDVGDGRGAFLIGKGSLIVGGAATEADLAKELLIDNGAVPGGSDVHCSCFTMERGAVCGSAANGDEGDGGQRDE
jgi:hypothetical protein